MTEIFVIITKIRTGARVKQWPHKFQRVTNKRSNKKSMKLPSVISTFEDVS